MSDKPYFNEETWKFFWHPVCTLEELRRASDRGPLMRVRLLGRKLVIAEMESSVVAMDDRCVHRSASLSLGWMENGCIRCPYHGWLYDANGKCVEIPSAPDMQIPEKARVKCYEAQVRYNLVWVRLDSSLATTIPELRSWDNPEMKCVQGNPYVWQTSAARRMENFFDLAHFAFVHDGSLGNRNDPLVPVPKIDLLPGQLRWKYYPKDRYGASSDVGKASIRLPMDYSDYVAQLPFHVSLINVLRDGSKTEIWMSASPVASDQVKCFWFTCRSEDHTGDDSKYTDIQEFVVLAEDKPVIESQDPAEIPQPPMELSIPTDKVHIYYRKRLAKLSQSYTDNGVEGVAKSLLEQRIESEEIHPELTDRV